MQPNNPLDCLSELDVSNFRQFGIGTPTPVPFACIHHAFESHVVLHPDLPAVIDFQDSISYAELDRKSNYLAAHLRSIGVDSTSRVCLLVERCISTVIAILATLKAGAAYVPLDGAIVSDATLMHIFNDAGVKATIHLRKFANRVNDVPAICMEDIVDQCPEGPCEKPRDLSSGSDSAYIIYTSGTTGVPKGVEVKHENVTNLVCLFPGNLTMAPGVKVSQLMNLAFDMAAWEILGSLSNGATLYLRGKTSKQWREVLGKVDVVIATPTMMAPHRPSDYPNIKVVATAGEPSSRALADGWAAQGKYYNCCGPTEITIVNTMQDHVVGQDLSIGKPTPNNNIYVLDESLRPVPIGEVGLMWAGGAGVTRGYLNLPDKTAERYKHDPFIDDGSLMFNTGDLGRWRLDGTLEHLGRIDDQVKIKGFRVELDGVSAALQTHPDVHAATALLINETLWGFVTPFIEDTAAIRDAAAKIQPYYAVPSEILPMEHFPKTANDKIDKRALRQLVLDGINIVKEQVAEFEKKDMTVIPFNNIINLDLPLTSPRPTHHVGSPEVTERTQEGHGPVAPLPSLPSESYPSSVGTTAYKSEASSSTELEKALPWEGYENDDIPEKTQGKWTRNLRHQVFTLYRRLFGVVFVVNMSIFIWVVTTGANAMKIGEIVVANLFCAILMRQDYVINAFFNVFCAVPTSWPLAIRRVCGRVYHIGGLHSGCAVSGVVWLILFAGKATKELSDNHKISIPTLVLTYCILVLLLGILTFANPSFRISEHDYFEMAHRFLGWTATAFVWGQVILLTNDYKEPGTTLGHALVRSPPFWLLSVLTISITLPWTRLRKVPVRSVVLSSHAVRLYFDYVTPVPGTFTRISDDPLREWHGFATIPEPGKKGYSLVVSKAGDWTTKQIQNPPTELWVRGIPTCGVLRIVPLFRRLVFVATGSGIGPCAPCILEQRVPIRLLWTSPNVRQTFGNELVDSILEASPDAVVYDTRTHGKPDMVKLTYRLVREFNAEAVCIISNQKLTRKVVYGMTSRGIPAFGAIWDS